LTSVLDALRLALGIFYVVLEGFWVTLEKRVLGKTMSKGHVRNSFALPSTYAVNEIATEGIETPLKTYRRWHLAGG